VAKQLQLRKGTATEHNTFTGADGEVTVDTTNKTLRVHDGSTVGGTRLATLTGGLVPTTQLPDATTSVKGAVILNNTLTSTSTTQALTAAQGKVLGDRDFGIGQTWQDVTAIRASGTTYTNSTGRAIEVSVSAAYQDGDGGLEARVGGILVGNLKGEAPSGTGFWNGTLTFTVPNLTNYNITGNPNVFVWSELR
jgi:hypothetical protein